MKRLFSYTWCSSTVQYTGSEPLTQTQTHTHRETNTYGRVNVAMWALVVAVAIAVTICECQSIYLFRTIVRCVRRFARGLLHISGVHQFIDIIECGEHSRLFVIGIGTQFVYIMAILSILSIPCGTHVFEESQYLNIIGCRLSQLIQLPVCCVKKKRKKRNSSTKDIL